MRCGRCEVDKPEDDFNWQNKAKGKRQGYCRECKKAHQRKYYEANRESYLKTTYRSRAARKVVARKHVITHLESHPCVDCGEGDTVVLHFDHVRGEKVDNVAEMICQGASLERLQAEIDKCEVRCANCHMRKTAVQLGWHSAPFV